MSSSYYVTYGTDRLTFGGSGSVAWKAPTYAYRTLWETNTPFRNLYSITLNDSIDNYDELIVYGSANRNTFTLKTENKYAVVPNTINQCGCYYAGRWDTASTYLLLNGTEMRLSGKSGYVDSSYFLGQSNNSTTWSQAVYNTARSSDLHPYKIVGVKEVR